jgi:hypothetical protein
MYISKGGSPYSFCPGKATWSHEAANLMSMVEITYLTRSLFFPGSISEQPAWYVELISQILPLYESSKSAQRQNAMWGGGGDAKGSQQPSNKRSAPRAKRRR